MRIVIAEDERPARERLLELIHACNPAATVEAAFDSVEDTVQYLKTHAHPDLLLLDIHLSDGHSFEIFKQVSYQRPVIFITAYDQYALDAFRHFSIDYILKPVIQEQLAAAFNKLQSLRLQFSAVDFTSLQPALLQQRYKKRFLGKIGQRLFFVDAEAVAYFQADDKIVFLVDKEGHRYVVDHTLEKLEEMLDPASFFRLNRKFIVHITAIQQVKPWHNSRLRLQVTGSDPSEEMIISRDRVAEFRDWATA